jgi:hypothetical protein
MFDRWLAPLGNELINKGLFALDFIAIPSMVFAAVWPAKLLTVDNCV